MTLQEKAEQVLTRDTLTRAELDEVIVAVYHTNNEFAKKPDLTRNTFNRFLRLCLKHKVDVLYGDANLAGLKMAKGRDFVKQIQSC